MEKYEKGAISAQLQGFLSGNPQSPLETRELPDQNGGKEEFLAINNPWEDPTLIVKIPKDDAEFGDLRDTLNAIVLPKRYSAIYHKDSKVLEVIWTALKRTAVAAEVENRSFDFIFNGRTHSCRFTKSSDRLLTLAKHCLPVLSPGQSDHRNIVSLHFFASGADSPAYGGPVSFFIDTHDLDEVQILELVRNLNAYMVYFDRLTPRVLTHEEVEGSGDIHRPRYIAGTFPGKIMARPLDSNVLSFWVEVANNPNPVMKFLLCYRILEYTAFNFVEAETRAKIKKLIAAPNVHDRIEKVAGDVAELVGIFKETHEIARTSNLVAATTDLERLWSYLEGQKAFFCKDCNFEGGFCVKALISDKETFENWKKNAVSTTLRALRELRNALSHGQDGQTRGTVQPSRANQELLRRWVNVIEMIAGDAMLYKEVV